MVYLNAISDDVHKISVDIPFKIVRDRNIKSVLTRSESKDYRVVYSKRVIVNHFDTLP
jgi:hypothetical protein